MTPRLQVGWIEVSDTVDEILKTVREHDFSRFPVCEGSLDHVIGIAHVKDMLLAISLGKSVDLRAMAREPLFVPETVEALSLVEMFRETRAEAAMVVDEHGGVEGLITMADIVQAIVGDFPNRGEEPVPQAVQREDGSWLVDGMLQVAELEELIGNLGISDQERSFSTIGGLVMAHLGRVPAVADHFETNKVRFEVMDMDGKRVDRVLVAGLREGGAQKISGE